MTVGRGHQRSVAVFLSLVPGSERAPHNLADEKGEIASRGWATNRPTFWRFLDPTLLPSFLSCAPVLSCWAGIGQIFSSTRLRVCSPLFGAKTEVHALDAIGLRRFVSNPGRSPAQPQGCTLGTIMPKPGEVFVDFRTPQAALSFFAASFRGRARRWGLEPGSVGIRAKFIWLRGYFVHGGPKVCGVGWIP